MTPDETSNVIPFPTHRRTQAQEALPLEPSDDEREVTIVRAMIRGWEQVVPEVGGTQARVGLGRATSAALEVLGDAGGMSIVVDGDPTAPALGCEIAGPGSAVAALRAAVAMRRAVATAQSPAPPEHQFRIGIGLDRGTIVRVQASEQLAFDAVGPMRMVAEKLRDFAGPGQIFLSRRIYEASEGQAQVQPLGDVRINIHGESEEAFSLVDLTSP